MPGYKTALLAPVFDGAGTLIGLDVLDTGCGYVAVPAVTITDTNPIPPQEFYRIDITLP